MCGLGAQFLGVSPQRTMFQFLVTRGGGYDVSAYSVFPHEKELLFLPGSAFEACVLGRCRSRGCWSWLWGSLWWSCTSCLGHTSCWRC